MNENAILTGGQPITVTDNEGNEHEVSVKLLKIKEFPDYFAKADDEESLAAFVTGKDTEFVSTLSVDAVLAICETAHDLNFQNACRWATRRANFSEALLPVAQKGIRMQQALGKFAPAVPSSSANQ